VIFLVPMAVFRYASGTTTCLYRAILTARPRIR
jgi:hypothetical protein